MAFGVATSSAGAIILCGNTTGTTPCTSLSLSTKRNLHIVSAKKLRSKKLRGVTTTTDQEPQRTVEIEDSTGDKEIATADWGPERMAELDETVRNICGRTLPALPGTEPDFFEGPQWDTVGFIADKLWIASVFLAILGGLYAAANYNVGAKDFKQTAAYKESVESSKILEQPEASDSDVFDSNPTEVAPSLE